MQDDEKLTKSVTVKMTPTLFKAFLATCEYQDKAEVLRGLIIAHVRYRDLARRTLEEVVQANQFLDLLLEQHPELDERIEHIRLNKRAVTGQLLLSGAA